MEKEMEINKKIDTITQQLVKAVAYEVVKECLKDIEAKYKGQAFRNTKRLLECYTDLKKHVDNAKTSVYDLQNDINADIQADPDFEHNYDIDMLEMEPDIFIQSIRRTRCRTIIMIAHIDSALRQLFIKTNAKGKGEAVKYKMLKAIFFEEKEFADVAKEYFCSESTVRRNVNDMIKHLSVMIFGSGGLNMF